MTFKCMKCETELELVSEGMVRCPNCGHRIMFKKRDPVVKTIKAF